jgi:hypothetical protein
MQKEEKEKQEKEKAQKQLEQEAEKPFDIRKLVGKKQNRAGSNLQGVAFYL